eukprot:gnl/TRDRNA2_/TRDRNA2_179153_c0_seq1.p1 gnl/TRDRNA2_/TRDRNA2_179153_c0~~gnl/TRDRNA2_/TRDRNA2_179153_c0_seq1.p1  ORF type:complete len:199 (-),score=29.01 gnl/TRDRNA2_/TRDRNA2_179153_c0_seq1:92-688(-)
MRNHAGELLRLYLVVSVILSSQLVPDAAALSSHPTETAGTVAAGPAAATGVVAASVQQREQSGRTGNLKKTTATTQSSTASALAAKYGPPTLGLVGVIFVLAYFVFRGGTAAHAAGERSVKEQMVPIPPPSSFSVLPLKDPRRNTSILGGSGNSRGVARLPPFGPCSTGRPPAISAVIGPHTDASCQGEVAEFVQVVD